MLSEVVAFVVMLNPFALFLYLLPIMKELDSKTFIKVIAKASLISFVIYAVFALCGQFLFNKLFQINFEAFRIFGGIVIFSFAYLFIIKGEKAMIRLKPDLDDVASEIALPFMVGAGTISLVILNVQSYSKMSTILMILIALSVNYLIIMFLKHLREEINRKKLRIAFDKNMEVFLRLNGFLVGAIGINMIMAGILNSMC